MGKKKKPPIPNYQRKSQRKIPALLAQSNKTNIAHIFANPNAWEKDIEAFARSYQDRISQDLLKTVPFWIWLQKQSKPDKSCEISWTSPLHRIVFGGLDPLSVAGSLATGGRYNVGAAQQVNLQELQNVPMQAALYGGDSIDCSKAEAGSFLQNAQIYEITPNRQLSLWDLQKAISTYAWPDLQTLVEGEPFNKLWKLQKTPAISQLFGSFLRSAGCDGILSRSTKYPQGNVITIFLKDDNESKNLFNSKLV